MFLFREPAMPRPAACRSSRSSWPPPGPTALPQDLADRKVIDRAKGLIMAQRGCTEEDAYASLRRRSMESNRKIADFAKDVLRVGEVLKVK